MIYTLITLVTGLTLDKDPDRVTVAGTKSSGVIMSPSLGPLGPLLAPLRIANTILVFFLLVKPSLQAEGICRSALSSDM